MESADDAVCIRTLRLKVKAESYTWLNAAAIETNQVWNWANATSYKAAFPCCGPRKWLTGYDLDKLAAGASKYFERIGSDVIQRIDAEFATRRKAAKKARLRWRVSRGPRRSLGWIPFKGVQLKRKGTSLRFCGKAFRVFEREKLEGVQWKSGSFSQDSVGDWWLNLSVERVISVPQPSDRAVGLDLGLKDTGGTSDGERLEAGRFYRSIEQKIAMAQRRGHKRLAKRLHRTAARRRQDALHKFSNKIIENYQAIIIGDVSSLKLAKTRMAKSVLDAGWGILKRQLQSKGLQAGRTVRIVSERDTTRACSSCGSLTGPSGLDSLVVREWVCGGCGRSHDRDVNAAKNILSRGEVSPSVCGIEPSPSALPPSPTSRRRKARISKLTAAA